MTSEMLAASAAILLSLLMAYVPGFASWYQAKTPDVKRLLMGGFLAVISLGAFGLSCLEWFQVDGVVCDAQGGAALLRTFILALVANQGVYALLPKAGLNSDEFARKAAAADKREKAKEAKAK